MLVVIQSCKIQTGSGDVLIVNQMTQETRVRQSSGQISSSLAIWMSLTNESASVYSENNKDRRNGMSEN